MHGCATPLGFTPWEGSIELQVFHKARKRKARRPALLPPTSEGIRMSRRTRLTGAALAVAAGCCFTAHGQTIAGTVKDPLGAIVPNATVDLLYGAKSVAVTTSGPDGTYTLDVPTNGRYALRVTASTFSANTTAPRFFRRAGHTLVDLTVATPTDTQEITVSATGTPTPIAQVGAAVTVLTSDEFAHVRDIQEPLRYVPGVQITQIGESGGTSGMSIRGGNINANKVVIDGIPADDLGGAVEFANISSAGIGSIEVLREPNSAVYGSDALAGVVSLTTRRGATPLPLFEYQGDAGNFHTYRNDFSVSGATRQFDYFSDVARQDTSNNQINDEYHNVTFAENAGYQPNSTTDLRFTFRHVSAEGGKPGATSLNGVADTAFSTEHDLYAGAVLNSQTTRNWHNQLRYGALRLDYNYNKLIAAPPTQTATITGANGYSVTGKATLSSPNVTINSSQRDFVYAQSDYNLRSPFGRTSHMLLLGGFKYESERGKTLSGSTTATTAAAVPGLANRRNLSGTMEVQGDAAGRFFYTVGSGIEENDVYGFAATPRLSGSYYLVRPGGNSFLSGTKLHSSFSKGIKSPSIYNQYHGLLELLKTANQQALATQNNVGPVGPEQSRSYDGGLDQELVHGKARLGLTYFHNQYKNSLEFLSQMALGNSAGFTFVLTNPAFTNGAYVNTLAYRGQGLEVELEAKLAQHLFARGGYTLLDAKVQNSFTSSALNQTRNTTAAFPSIVIGSSAPLRNARPFRRARNSGYFGLAYTRARWNAAVNGTLVGYRDDSDFLTTALLLPNHNLDGRYQRVELTGEYRVTPRISAYTEIQNLLSEHYQEAFGYPTLPLNFRTGLRINFGGESWKVK